jgi:hypothetical protein
MTVKVSPDRQIVGIGYLSYTNSTAVTLSNDEHTDYKWVNREQLFDLLDDSLLNILRENNVFDLLEID